MRSRGLLGALALGLSLVLALLWIFGTHSPPAAAGRSKGSIEAPNAPSAEIHVCPSGSPTCDYASVQAAVDAAGFGDVIKVAAGTYTDVDSRNGFTQLVYISKTVTIEGGYTTTDWTTSDPDAHPATLDAQGEGRVFYITGDISPTVKGLRITGGDAAGQSGADNGGDAGGGMYVITATVTVSDCLIHDNRVDSGSGGGIYLTGMNSGTINGNIFLANSVSRGGGGLSLMNGTITISDNSFTDNHAGDGGGLYIFGSNSTLEGNLVNGNTSLGGAGGLNLGMFSGTLDGNVVISNTANGDGGGMVIFGGNTWYNNVVADNHAGGSGSALYIMPMGPDLVHTTIARNSGGDGTAVYVSSGPIPGATDVTLVNTIFVSHSVGISVTAGHTVTVDTVLWHNTPTTVSVAPGGYATADNEFTGDPVFAADGYHLTPASAAIDKGAGAGVEMDIDGEPRPAGDGYDLGADEFWYRIHLPLVIRNDQP